ncbi:unnamed protein product [Cylindrotheca closterium]|uniref:Aspartoacylase n=1 Tax=Cylindrotheca closterium TaxID=2856 RepID=A0AAD2JHJ4_9STRA|nr:unnamed protein product [Cylindrotheca closterium]
MQNKRFVDTDLNRQFTYDALQDSDANNENNSWEAKRAKEINELLGPKQFDDDSESSTTGKKKKADSDVIIDLHTTTTNMGTTLIVGAGDPLMTQCAAYIRAKCGVDNVKILMHTHERQHDRPQLSSIASSYMSIEVGPVPQGVLRHDVVEKTQAALEAAFCFLDKCQCEKSNEVLQQELKEYYPNGQVPCYRSAPSQREGEMSSKIPWPCDPDNENFPSWMVHKNVQDQDFALIHKGDPLFVDLDGTVIQYDGSHGSPVRLMFINEGGYYYASSGTGISVAQLDHFHLESGELI